VCGSKIDGIDYARVCGGEKEKGEICRYRYMDKKREAER
jgi:hypothetical protein